MKKIILQSNKLVFTLLGLHFHYSCIGMKAKLTQIKRFQAAAMSVTASRIASLASHIRHAYDWAGHWVPHHHFVAVTCLSLALGAVFLLPDSSDARSARTVIHLDTDEVAAVSPSPNALLDELETVLQESELSLPNTSRSMVLEPAAGALNTNPSSESAALEPRLILEVKSGDSLSTLFQKAGLNDRDIHAIATGNENERRVLSRIYPGYRLAFDIRENALESLEIITNPLESWVFTLSTDGSYSATHVEREPELKQTQKQAVITDSLFLAAQQGGIPAALTMELADIFGGVIDFMLDTRRGDTFSVLYEEKFLDGEFIGNGNILAASFTIQGETFSAYRYVDPEGTPDYFNPDGESMRKAFLKNPVDFIRISSDFNPNRRHPISNTIRAHRGTDYAAPSGTPVVATSDGKVTWAARNGSFGNLVVIQHSDRFETKYAHLSKFANGVRSGSRVRQGQVIGYVGSTGAATGPHLHFEFLMDGVHRNWRTIQDKLPKAVSIPASELAGFRQQTQQIAAQLEALHDPVAIAMLDKQSRE